MEFSGRSMYKKRKLKVCAESSYPTSLQFYIEPPNGNLSLKEFDEMAVERLKILRTIERWNLSGQIKSSEDWMNKIYEDFFKNKSFIIFAEKQSGDEKEILEARKCDLISHFILRLAYCRTEELRRWFISHEVDLFRCRFLRAAINGEDLDLFLSLNNLHFTPISKEEISSESSNLAAATYNINSIEQLENKVFYKVSFIEAIELVRTRKVYLKDGFAYVPNTDLVTLVAAVFRSKLSHALVKTCRALPELDDDERLVSMLQDFDKRYTGNDYSQKKSIHGQKITPEMISQISAKSFPLCMRQMQEHLHSQSHLKHGGRMQYGLFLKAAGLSLDDAMNYWRSHFVKKMDVDKFEKQYSYTIRHNYGKEGKRTDYTPYSCMKIIMGSVGPGDAHGCPFRHSDESILRQKLAKYRVSQQSINEIIDLSSRSHYQIACQRFWEATHNAPLDVGINHPNQYFEESMKHLHGTDLPKKAPSQVKGQRSVVYDSPSNKSQTSKQDITTDSLLLDDDDDFDMSLLEKSLDS